MKKVTDALATAKEIRRVNQEFYDFEAFQEITGKQVHSWLRFLEALDRSFFEKMG